MLKLNRFKDGKMEQVFDKPQPPLKTSKVATLEIVADKFCGKQKTPVSASAAGPCVKALADMRRLELTRSEEHTSELQSLMRISYAGFCLKKKTTSTHKKAKTQR